MSLGRGDLSCGATEEKPKTAKQLLNTDLEPNFKEPAFVSLFDGKTLNGWNIKQGTMKFEVRDG